MCAIHILQRSHEVCSAVKEDKDSSIDLQLCEDTQLITHLDRGGRRVILVATASLARKETNRSTAGVAMAPSYGSVILEHRGADFSTTLLRLLQAQVCRPWNNYRYIITDEVADWSKCCQSCMMDGQ